MEISRELCSAADRMLNVLRLMECLTPTASFNIFVDAHFTFFHLLTQLGFNNIRATGVLNKMRLCKCTITGEKQLQKRNVVTLNISHSAKMQCIFDNGWLERQHGGLHSG